MNWKESKEKDKMVDEMNIPERWEHANAVTMNLFENVWVESFLKGV